MGIELRSLRVVSHPPAELHMPALTEAPCRALTEATGPAGGQGADADGGGLRGGALAVSASAVSSPRAAADDDERAPRTYGPSTLLPSTYAPISREVRDDDADT